MDEQLHSLSRRLIELRMEHAHLGVMVDSTSEVRPLDELGRRRPKERRILLRHLIVRPEMVCDPDKKA